MEDVPGAPLMTSAVTVSLGGTCVISEGWAWETSTPVWGAEELSCRANDDTDRSVRRLTMPRWATRRRDMAVGEQGRQSLGVTHRYAGDLADIMKSFPPRFCSASTPRRRRLRRRRRACPQSTLTTLFSSWSAFFSLALCCCRSLPHHALF